jgi:hypothetical protein
MIFESGSSSGTCAGPVPAKIVLTSPCVPGSSARGPGERLLGSQVGDLHHAAEVKSGVPGRPDERRQRPAAQVVGFEFHICETHDLRQERVGPDEPAQRVAELVLPPGLQTVEPVEPVHEQREVQGLARACLVGQLPGDREPVLPVAPDQIRGQTVRGPEVGEPDRHPEVRHAAPQHVHRATRVKLLGQPVVKRALGNVRVAAMQREQRVPVLDLGRTDESGEFRGIDAPLRIEVAGRTCRISAVLSQRSDDLRLKRDSSSVMPAPMLVPIGINHKCREPDRTPGNSKDGGRSR